MTERVAFIGTGLIGGGLAEAALRRNDGSLSIAVWNRTASKTESLAALGAEVAATAAEAVAGARRVHITMTADEAVNAQLDAIAGALADDAVVIDHSTTSPEGTRARAERCAGDGIAYLHAPVFMSPQACREAKGWMLVAGPEALYERVAMALAPMTGEVWFVGDTPDRAAALKLVGNAMILTMVAGVADIFAMGRGLGLAPDTCLDLFDRFNPTGVLKGRGRKMAQGHYVPGFALEMARKDIGLMEQAVDEALPMAVLPAIAARMDDLISDGHGDADVGILALEAVPSREDP
jgi:3-hydroxyisobutyrate dehydrogenase-like beta-hydroxyacid dehydrogenase